MTACIQCGEPGAKVAASAACAHAHDAVGADLGQFCSGCAPIQCAKCGKRSCAEHRLSVGCGTCGLAPLCSECGFLNIDMSGAKINSSIVCADHFSKAAIDEKDSSAVTACPFASLEADKVHQTCWKPGLTLYQYTPMQAMTGPWGGGSISQREHLIPNSCFTADKGRTGPSVEGAESYKEGNALCYWVHDGQKAGFEHKYLTDHERSFCKGLQAQHAEADLGMWLRYMELKIYDSLMRQGAYKGGKSDDPCAHPRGWLGDCSEGMEACARLAARSMRTEAEYNYKVTLGIPLNTQLRNGLAGLESINLHTAVAKGSTVVVDTSAFEVPKPSGAKKKLNARTRGMVSTADEADPDAEAKAKKKAKPNK
jgi:hypothetical protein